MELYIFLTLLEQYEYIFPSINVLSFTAVVHKRMVVKQRNCRIYTPLSNYADVFSNITKKAYFSGADRATSDQFNGFTF